ncbi:asparagine synthetase B family protein [Umezawaea sp. NPDC059074]|uniref:asparagine synthetase B family protein n=1 Tax=Umezawaea sp. NPDC059074 TaxID=3346716 RepID=UPI00368B1B58
MLRQDSAHVVVAFDGYLHGVASGSEADVVLRDHLRWGEAAAERWEGAFAFAIWDGRTGELVLGRDRMGVKPLSFAVLDEGVVFASELAVLAVHPSVVPELDGRGLNALITQVRGPGLGVLRGVREVRPGTTVRFSRTGERHRRYWSLEAHPHDKSTADTVACVRELLVRIVADNLDDADPAVLLSGGTDSSVLTGLVAGALGRSPHTFTVTFGKGAAAVVDLPHAEEVARFWGTAHRTVVVEPVELSDPGTLNSALLAKDHPTPFGDKNITPYLFSRVVAARTSDALSGEGADALFGGLGPSPAPDRVLTTFPWIERARSFDARYGLGGGLFRQDLLRDTDIAGYLADRFDDAMAEVPRLAGESPVDRLGREVDYLTVTRLLEQTVHHSERLSTAAGLRLRFPFADHRLFSFLYDVPPRVKAFDGREKSLLRAAGRDLVPPSVLRRPKVPYPITYDKGYKAGLVVRLRALLDDSSAAVHDLLDLSSVVRYVENPRLLDRGGWLGRADVEMALQLNDWIQCLGVRVRL